MFASATLKLTAWYLAILMAISLIFSIAIFQVASSEVSLRLEGLQLMLENNSKGYVLPAEQAFFELRQSAADKAALSLFVSLIYANFTILIAGGLAAFWMANRALRPIEQSHEIQVRFVNDASHELRTPLAIMQTELEVALRDASLSKKESKEVIESTLEEVIKLSKLSNTLLELSKFEVSSMSDIDMERFDLTPTISQIVKRHNTADNRLTLKSPKSPMHIYANRVMIEELTTILIDNALKYSPAKSKVNLELKRKHGNAVMAITNSGEGISANVLPRIFDRFYRVDKSRSKSGHGLGLSIAKKIVQIHNGNLSVKSGHKQPTTFTVSFPTVKKPSNKV